MEEGIVGVVGVVEERAKGKGVVVCGKVKCKGQ